MAELRREFRKAPGLCDDDAQQRQVSGLEHSLHDMDLFVVLRKIDAAGREVPFFGYNGYPHDAVAKGWLRVSHRELDPAKSRPGRPWHTHRTARPLRPGEIVDAEIEILPSSTVFEAASSLRLDILGHDAARYPVFRHGVTANRGRHRVLTGPDHPSVLRIPVKERTNDPGEAIRNP